MIVPSSDYLAAVRALCDERGILFMADEVQTGLGRTGRWFGFQHTAVMPDVITMAKALGNGVPIGACWARAEVAAAFGPGDHGSTFGGQPLATAAAAATLAVMEAEDVPARARRAGARLTAALEALDGGGPRPRSGAPARCRPRRRPGRGGDGGGVGRRTGGERPASRHDPARPLAAGDRRGDRRRRARSWPGCGSRDPALPRHRRPLVRRARGGPDPGGATGGVLAGGPRRAGGGPRLREAVGPDPQLDRAGGGRRSAVTPSTSRDPRWASTAARRPRTWPGRWPATTPSSAPGSSTTRSSSG